MQEKDNISKDLNSNSSVLNLSLNISNNKETNNDNYSDSCSNSSFDIPKFLSKTIILKEEKEEAFPNASFEIKNKEKEITRKRSKTDYIPICLINNAPKIKPKDCNDEQISPLTLSRKTFFQEYSNHKSTYNILYDFQKDIIDSKSCNNDNIYENSFSSDDTERTTINVNDLNDFSICRKKMKNIINNSNIKSSFEYENILNSNNIFQIKNDLFYTKFNSNKNKKSNFWHKHIVKQNLLLFSKDKINKKNKNKNTYLNKSKTFNFDKKKTIDNQGLFILGVLESAANEKKKRITMGNCC